MSRFLWLALSLTSCIATTSFDRFDPTPRTALYAVSGTVDGLAFGTVSVLLDGKAMDFGNGPFAFARNLADGASYRVTVVNPDRHMCSVDHDAGTIAAADATDVRVHCVPNDAALTGLSVSIAPLSPAFDPATIAYGAGARTSAIFGTTTTVTATARDPNARITINKVDTMSGAPSVPIALVGGPNSIDVVVTSTTGTATAHYAIAISGAPNPNDYLKASNTHSYLFFGNAVALDGDTLAIGAKVDNSGIPGNELDSSALDSGAVHVFTRVGTAWTKQAYLKAPNPIKDAHFGTSIALLGNTLVVGAPYESNFGAVYVFTRSGATWSFQARITSTNPHVSFATSFGNAVALSADTLAVGDIGEWSHATGINGDQSDTSMNYAGAVYVFTRSGAVWSPQAYVKASNTRTSAVFGTSVALSGDTLVVGSPGESSVATGINGDQSDGFATGTGAAYVFTRSGMTWTQQAYVKASNTSTNYQSFAAAVAISADTLVVGAPNEASSAKGVNGDQTDVSAGGAGACYVFTRSNSVWSHQAYVKASNTRASSHFGSSLALSGEAVAIGASDEASKSIGVNGNQTDTSLYGAGAVYVFTRTGTMWSQLAYVKASNTQVDMGFGLSIALDGTSLAVGAPDEASKATGVNGDQSDTSAPSAGAAYVF